MEGTTSKKLMKLIKKKELIKHFSKRPNKKKAKNKKTLISKLSTQTQWVKTVETEMKTIHFIGCTIRK
jgi:hypothetical protein